MQADRRLHLLPFTSRTPQAMSIYATLWQLRFARARIPFQDWHGRLCDALRGARPRLAFQVFGPERSMPVFDTDS